MTESRSARKCPYVGLVPFAPEDAPYFFGRDAEREIVAANLMASKLTLLYGASGVGKSSVLRAGVIHDQREQARQNLGDFGNPEFIVVEFREWQDDPLVGIATAISDAVKEVYGDREFPSPPERRSLVELCQWWTDQTEAELLFVFDQFEEYFLYHADKRGSDTFDSQFPAAVNRRELKANFLIAVRQDAIASLDRFKGRVQGLFDNRLSIGHLSRDAAREAIEGPIEYFNSLPENAGNPISVQPELAEEVLKEVRTGRTQFGRTGRGAVKSEDGDFRVEAPFLQLVMTRLWDEEQRLGQSRLKLETLKRLGGADKIVRTHLDRSLESLEVGQRKTVARILDRLVTPSGGKIALTTDDLADISGRDVEDLQPILEQLAGPSLRLLRPVDPPPDQPHARRYEIFHDVLAAAILDWQARYVAERRFERLFRIVAGSLLLVGVMVGLTAYAIVQSKKAKESAEQARAAQVNAEKLIGGIFIDKGVEELEGKDGREPNVARALTYFAAALKAANSKDHEPMNSTARGLIGGWTPHLGQPLLHDGWVSAVAFSPDGKTVLTGSADTARLWDAATGAPRGEPMKHEGSVLEVAFSPDGKTVLTGSGPLDPLDLFDPSGEARLWDAATGAPRGEPMKHEGIVSAVAFSPDGKTVLTGSDDNTARLWDAATGAPHGEPMKHDSDVYAVAFSPDDKTVLTGSRGNTARLWDAATGAPRGELMKHEGSVYAVAFSPDGKTVFTGSEDNTARLWDAATGAPRGEPMKHDSDVYAVAFSPDGKTVLTASRGNTARLRDAATGAPRGEPMKHEDIVSAVAFSPDGKTVLTGSEDNTARLWDAATGAPRGEPMKHEDLVYAVAFSPDGKTVLTGIRDTTARLWDAATGAPHGEPMKHEGSVFEVAFSPDGKTVLTGSDDNTARLWDAATGAPHGEPMKHEGSVLEVAFSPDGKTVLTGSEDNTARLWDAATGAPRGELMKHEGSVYAVAFSPDGKTVFTGSEDNTARLWDAATGAPHGEPMKHEGIVFAVAFSPDGKTVLTASRGNTARLWDAATGAPRGEPMKHEDLVYAVAFSPDGKTVLTGSEDNTARLWDAATGAPRGEPMRHEDFVSAVAFSPDGKTVLTGSDDNTARLWGVPPPAKGDPKLVMLSVEVRTGYYFDKYGTIRRLTQAQWLEKREQLMKSGGPVDGGR